MRQQDAHSMAIPGGEWRPARVVALALTACMACGAFGLIGATPLPLADDVMAAWADAEPLDATADDGASASGGAASDDDADASAAADGAAASDDEDASASTQQVSTSTGSSASASSASASEGASRGYVGPWYALNKDCVVEIEERFDSAAEDEYASSMAFTGLLVFAGVAVVLAAVMFVRAFKLSPRKGRKGR